MFIRFKLSEKKMKLDLNYLKKKVNEIIFQLSEKKINEIIFQLSERNKWNIIQYYNIN